MALGLLRADAPGGIMRAPEDWPRWAVLLPHVLAATSHASWAGQELVPGSRDDLSWLLDRAGTYLHVQAQLTQARPLFERALAIDEGAYGPGHPEVATDLSNLASLLRDLGQAGAARPLQERALAIRQGRALPADQS